jgi:hypothetical protein
MLNIDYKKKYLKYKNKYENKKYKILLGGTLDDILNDFRNHIYNMKLKNNKDLTTIYCLEDDAPFNSIPWLITYDLLPETSPDKYEMITIKTPRIIDGAQTDESQFVLLYLNEKINNIHKINNDGTMDIINDDFLEILITQFNNQLEFLFNSAQFELSSLLSLYFIYYRHNLQEYSFRMYDSNICTVTISQQYDNIEKSHYIEMKIEYLLVIYFIRFNSNMTSIYQLTEMVGTYEKYIYWNQLYNMLSTKSTMLYKSLLNIFKHFLIDKCYSRYDDNTFILHTVKYLRYHQFILDYFPELILDKVDTFFFQTNLNITLSYGNVWTNNERRKIQEYVDIYDRLKRDFTIGEGQDGGGLTRNFITILLLKLFDNKNRLIKFTDCHTPLPFYDSQYKFLSDDEKKNYVKLIGKLLNYIYNNAYLNACARVIEDKFFILLMNIKTGSNYVECLPLLYEQRYYGELIQYFIQNPVINPSDPIFENADFYNFIWKIIGLKQRHVPVPNDLPIDEAQNFVDKFRNRIAVQNDVNDIRMAIEKMIGIRDDEGEILDVPSYDTSEAYVYETAKIIAGEITSGDLLNDPIIYSNKLQGVSRLEAQYIIDKFDTSNLHGRTRLDKIEAIKNKLRELLPDDADRNLENIEWVKKFILLITGMYNLTDNTRLKFTDSNDDSINAHTCFSRLDIPSTKKWTDNGRIIEYDDDLVLPDIEYENNAIVEFMNALDIVVKHSDRGHTTAGGSI